MSVMKGAGIAGVAALGILAPTTLIAAGPASAAPHNCSAWVTSSGLPGGGVSGYCLGETGQYRVVGLCKNIITNASNWVYGPWLSSGLSAVKCQWYQVPQSSPYVQVK